MHQLDRKQAQAIDAIFAPWDNSVTPGAAISIVKDGQPIYQRGYGMANLEYALPITADTVFHVASVSKQFTTAAILVLAADGLLRVDDDVRSHLPYVPEFGHRISLAQLIHHASGMRDQWELLRWAGWRMDDVITQEHILKLVRRQRALNFAPGDEHLYSNTGYTLLAEVVSRVSGKSLREFTAERLFGPLNMSRTLFFADHEEIVPDRAYSYAPSDAAGFKKSVLSFANVGATSLFTTARDLGRWMLHLAEIDGSPLAQAMQTRLVLNSGETHTYAGGLDLGERRGLRAIGHTGSDAGYRSYCGRFPDFGLGIAILSNLAAMEPAKLAERVAEVLVGEHMAPAPRSEEPRDPRELGMDLAEFAGEYIVAEAGLRVAVSRGDRGLLVKVGAAPPSPLTPVGADRFHHLDAREAVTFARSRGPGSPPDRIVVPVYGQMITARRLGPPLPPADAAVYVGDYYSQELDTTYRLRPGAHGVCLTHQRIPHCDLLPLGPGEFAVDRPGGGRMSFGDGGQVTGFTLNGTRCRRLAFAKLG